MVRMAVIVLLMVCALGSGCARHGIGWWRGFKSELNEDVKAASGTGEFLGMSDEAREIERSLGEHRK